MHANRVITCLATLFIVVSGIPTPSWAQCILANPSFEITGSGGSVFGGWEQFGSIGWTHHASHGSRAARVIGPGNGSWEVSGYWQQFDCSEGEQWEITGHVMNPSWNPILGQCAALVNVEWRDAAGELIDYDTFTVADLNSPLDEYIDFTLTSSPAPTGTVATRLLIGVLQSPSDPVPEAVFDQITYFSTWSPTIDEMQWTDFPGGRSVEFADRSWHVKGPGWYGPGPSNFSHLPVSVWVDENDRLHLSIKYLNGNWQSTEVVLEDALGYGDYIFTTLGPLDQLDIHAVLGLFLWQYGPCWDNGYLWWNPYNEIDVEFSRWGNPGNEIAQFVAQPYDWPGNISHFDASFGVDEFSSHAFNWLADRVEFRSWRGGPNDESPENMLHEWIYSGPHIPRPEQPRVHMNLWQFDGPPTTEQEVILDDFTFIPEGGSTGVIDLPEFSLPSRIAQLYPNAPNPFNPSTTLHYELRRDSRIKLSIYDLAGSHVRTLFEGYQSSGQHQSTWDGKCERGSSVASGVYLCRLQAGGEVSSQRMVLIK